MTPTTEVAHWTQNTDIRRKPDAVVTAAEVAGMGPRVALAHDYLAQAGGAERVVEAIHGMYPDAPVYTSVYDRKATLSYFRDKDIRTSFLQRMPFRMHSLHKIAFPLYPLAFEQFDLSSFDVVISSSSSFAKGVITGPDCCHICYCHTPARFAWRHHEYMSRGTMTRLLAPALAGTLSKMRAWDINSNNRVDFFVANSHNIARRIRKYYRRDATVIYPPVDTTRFAPAAPSEVGSHFLVVSRLIGYKRIDLAVQASAKFGFPLRVVGDGPEMSHLKAMAGPKTTFLGRLSDKEIAREFATCKALIFPGEEDFGITPLECMASGRPVIAFARGGALETVVEDVTGVFFHSQTVDSLGAAMEAVGRRDFGADVLVEHAHQFDTKVFRSVFSSFVERAVAEFREGDVPGSAVRGSLGVDRI
jgi:glycosyltransferase involved in cell wall biosynthesis